MLSINKEVKLENQAESSPTVHKGWFNPRTAVSNGYPVSLEKKKIQVKFFGMLYMHGHCTFCILNANKEKMNEIFR